MKAATMNSQYDLKSIMTNARKKYSSSLIGLSWSECLKSAWSEAKLKMSTLKATLIAVTSATPDITIPKFKYSITDSISEPEATPQPDREPEIAIFQITFNPTKSEDEYMQVHNVFFETLDTIPTLDEKIKWLDKNLLKYFKSHNSQPYIYHYLKDDIVYFNGVVVREDRYIRIFKGFTYDYKANIITYRQDQYQSLKGLLVELFVKAGIETSLKDWKKGVYDRTYIKSKALDLGFWDNTENRYHPGKEDLFLFLKNKLS